MADNTPLLIVQFRLDTKSPEGEFAFWKDSSTSRLTWVKCPNQTLILLHRLLLLNSKRAGPGGDGHRNANLKPSFILPIGPIEKTDIAQLARDLSCAVCGKQSKRVAPGVNVSPYFTKSSLNKSTDRKLVVHAP